MKKCKLEVIYYKKIISASHCKINIFNFFTTTFVKRSDLIFKCKHFIKEAFKCIIHYIYDFILNEHATYIT